MTSKIAIVSLGARSAALAARLKALLPDSTVHAPACAACEADVHFAKATEHIGRLFVEGRAIVGLCASGILIRAVASRLGDKRAEPALIAVAEDGSAVVPLLGGHRGANDLARRIAAALGVPAAVTTAGDNRFDLALDAPPSGWTLANPEHAKEVMARLLEGEPVRLTVEAGDAAWLKQSTLPFAAEAGIEILVTHRAVAGTPERLVYHPPVLALGVGAEQGAPAEALEALVRAVLEEQELAPAAVACVVSLDLKAAEPAVHALARRLGVPARFFPAGRLLEETERLSGCSEIVFRETGCWGVAEGAALAAAGKDGRLLVPKRKGERVTAAVALAARALDPAAIGRPRGRLAVVGLGPGGRHWRTEEAERLIAEAEELVGYGLYLDLIGPAAAGKPRHVFPLGAEVERCRFALARAAEGRNVALVCSGDPGIYALATLVFELVASGTDPAWARVDIVVSPGVSALQAAAARAGAPLGHDFCAISLSDLLTPFEAILRRVEAAAEGDFVIAFYNPVSARRREALARARDILLRHRPPATPVILARNLGRPEESLRLIRLDELAPELCDMLTLVLVGSSTSRRVPRLFGADWVYTPRGYEVS
ncbi:precorrin-3B C(17)-methyltransferase [Benzoatithermus flavus]|uniref:Precorrin-3B C(17)-methyltransferase n=1 Tax=Benzoatithermus flavus TaxID=3108223 RepID=A0ABU8XME8_9PROT